MENNQDGRVNKRDKEYIDMIVEVKPNQGITTKWVGKQLRELIILGTVRNVKQLTPNSIQMTIKSEFVDLVKIAINGSFEVLKYYAKE